jgi:hypothetical protein
MGHLNNTPQNFIFFSLIQYKSWLEKIIFLPYPYRGCPEAGHKQIYLTASTFIAPLQASKKTCPVRQNLFSQELKTSGWEQVFQCLKTIIFPEGLFFLLAQKLLMGIYEPAGYSINRKKRF